METEGAALVEWYGTGGTLWDCIGYLGMPQCEEVKSPTCSQQTVLFNGLLDLSLSWGSLGRI